MVKARHCPKVQCTLSGKDDTMTANLPNNPRLIAEVSPQQGATLRIVVPDNKINTNMSISTIRLKGDFVASELRTGRVVRWNSS